MRGHFVAALIGLLCVAGCGGGGSSVGSSGQTVTGTAANVQAVVVDTGPATLVQNNRPAVNTVYTSVTICVPGSTTSCQTIDHIQVDTGSSGLRIIASQLSLSLPLQMDASGNVVAECTQFIDGYSWGPVRKADVRISGESAAATAIQVIGDAAYQTVPTNCSMPGSTTSPLNAENTVLAFGANGILGVGPFISDCGSACTTSPNGVYFVCPTSSSCQDAAMTTAQQVANPAAFFAADNNGVIIELSPVGASGAASLQGSLVFGIGTQSNNGLGSATVYAVDSGNGSLTAQYNGAALTDSFIDSGSNAYYFPDSTITVCDSTTSAPGFFCPAATLNLSATIEGSPSAVVQFSVANANSLFSGNSTLAAAGNLGAPSTGAGLSSTGFNGANSFDFGLPFYFGRNVFTAFETRNTAGGLGPYFAF